MDKQPACPVTLPVGGNVDNQIENKGHDQNFLNSHILFCPIIKYDQNVIEIDSSQHMMQGLEVSPWLRMFQNAYEWCTVQQ